MWFQHFHKAAGSSIVEIAQRNGERCYPCHANGNPMGADGRPLPLWEYTAGELLCFVDECESLGVTFVATEWGLPDITALSQDTRVLLLACLRHPLDRYVSNFYFDLYLGFTPARNLASYVGSRKRTITMFNYYCRVLSGHDNKGAEITEKEYTVARNNLSKFDCVIAVEGGLHTLEYGLGWHVPDLQSNKSHFGLRYVASLLKRGRIRLALIRIFHPRKSVPTEFLKTFEPGNHWDYSLYHGVIHGPVQGT